MVRVAPCWVGTKRRCMLLMELDVWRRLVSFSTSGGWDRLGLVRPHTDVQDLIIPVVQRAREPAGQADQPGKGHRMVIHELLGLFMSCCQYIYDATGQILRSSGPDRMERNVAELRKVGPQKRREGGGRGEARFSPVSRWMSEPAPGSRELKALVS